MYLKAIALFHQDVDVFGTRAGLNISIEEFSGNLDFAAYLGEG